jgi:small subunit ribosomal protein S8e
MAILQLRSNRKHTGGRYKRPKVRRLGQLGRLPVLTKIAERRVRTERTKGGNKKDRLLSINKINVYDAQAKSYEVLPVESTAQNPANRHYVRRNILTKGCVVNTSKGLVKITSRPGQERVLNGILVK